MKRADCNLKMKNEKWKLEGLGFGGFVVFLVVGDIEKRNGTGCGRIASS
jgi:hypothetical protein